MAAAPFARSSPLPSQFDAFNQGASTLRGIHPKSSKRVGEPISRDAYDRDPDHAGHRQPRQQYAEPHGRRMEPDFGDDGARSRRRDARRLYGRHSSRDDREHLGHNRRSLSPASTRVFSSSRREHSLSEQEPHRSSRQYPNPSSHQNRDSEERYEAPSLDSRAFEPYSSRRHPISSTLDSLPFAIRGSSPSKEYHPSDYHLSFSGLGSPHGSKWRRSSSDDRNISWYSDHLVEEQPALHQSRRKYRPHCNSERRQSISSASNTFYDYANQEYRSAQDYYFPKEDHNADVPYQKATLYDRDMPDTAYLKDSSFEEPQDRCSYPNSSPIPQHQLLYLPPPVKKPNAFRTPPARLSPSLSMSLSNHSSIVALEASLPSYNDEEDTISKRDSSVQTSPLVFVSPVENLDLPDGVSLLNLPDDCTSLVQTLKSNVCSPRVFLVVAAEFKRIHRLEAAERVARGGLECKFGLWHIAIQLLISSSQCGRVVMLRRL